MGQRIIIFPAIQHNMPLNYEKPIIKKIPIIQKVGNIFFKLLALIRPETILGVFLLAAIIFSSLQLKVWGFYAMFGIFTIGYFCERIIIRYGRRKKLDKTD